MRRPLRVLHIALDLHHGGLQRLIADLSRAVDPSRFETHVLVLTRAGRFASDLAAGSTLHESEPMSRLSMVWPRSLASRIRTIAPDVVHTHSGLWYKASLAARLAGVPRLIHTDHGRPHPDPWVARLVDGLASRRTDVVVAVSGPLAEQLRSTVLRGHPDLRVIPNGIDTERFRPRPDTGELRDELGVSPTSSLVGTIGRLDAVKGYDVLLRGFRLLLDRDRGETEPPTLLLVGDGPERERLTRLAAELGLGDRARLLGWRDDLPRIHAALQLFTLSSLSEGTSLGLLEAMSAGICPVVTRVGGNPDVLGPRLAHRLVGPGDPVALADAWALALGDAAARRRDAAVAREEIVRRYPLARMAREYEALYEEGARSSRSAPVSSADG